MLVPIPNGDYAYHVLKEAENDSDYAYHVLKEAETDSDYAYHVLKEAENDPDYVYYDFEPGEYDFRDSDEIEEAFENNLATGSRMSNSL